ncbi:MAG: hypothetical protein KGZ42_04775, partial [Melioribacter sp.]|nr:hypothetical protein [Melioribacter sp.]
MKKLLLILLITTVTNANPLYTWDWQFFVRNSSNQLVGGIYIAVAYYDRNTESIDWIASGHSSSTADYNGANAALNIIETNEIPEGEIPPNITPAISRMQQYIVRIGNTYIRIEHNGYDDETFYYNTDTYTISTYGAYIVHANNCGSLLFNIKLKNDYDGGAMYIRKIYESSIPITGRTVSRLDYTFPHELTAVEGLYGSDGYKRLWAIWNDNFASTTRYLNEAGNYLDFEARFDKEFNLTFQTGGKPFTADGNNYSSDATLYKREQSTFTAIASNITYNDVAYTFLYWKKDGNIVSNNITANGNSTYVAWYSAKPNVNNRNLTSNSQVGQNVTLIWNAHPNSNVTGYKVYRKVKINGVVGPETLLATITSRYTTSYTDYEYTITNDPNDDRLMYDVRPRYTDSQNSNIESDPYYETIAFGIIEFSKTDNFAQDI